MSCTGLASKATFLLAASAIAFSAHAQDVGEAGQEATDSDVIVVTATRRASTVQDVPINISAIGGVQLEERRLDNLREVARAIPGVYVVDQGSRSGTPIVFRGLNATGLGSFDGNNDGGGTVATYVGEIPLYIDLRINDIERVEFLIGPQGTLYGAGTLGGAIRYIPARPDFDGVSGEVRGDAYDYASGGGISFDVGGTVNVPLTDNLALRASVDYLEDQGFIDYPFAVQEVGVSNPDANPADAAAFGANLRPLSDVNFEKVISGRVALRLNPVDALDATLTYHFQKDETGGRQFSQRRLSNYPVEIGKYESALRVPEPNERTTQLVSLELELDLGFANLVSATGYSTFDDDGNRDQTDLLIGLEYSYEQFPEFTAFTREVSEEETLTQELRLVSAFDGPFSFIVGGFFNERKQDNVSTEFTPGYDQFAVDEFGGVQLRPDSIEYIAPFRSRLTELAAFGEFSYQLTDAWQVTVGGRYYDYSLTTAAAVDLPVFETVFNGRDPESIVFDFEPGGQKDNGFLFKFNTSYEINPDVLIYATVSQGYRIGNSNGTAACPNPLPDNQIICALPNEIAFGPDETLNYELGFKTQFFDRRLTLNGAIYYIDWSDPQIASATLNGQSPITINGNGAETRGAELSAVLELVEGLSIRGTYSYTDPKLTEDSPNIIPVLTGNTPFDNGFSDGFAGDRLPGSPKHQGSLFVDYKFPVGDNLNATLSYGVYAQSDVATRTGERGASLTLPGFDQHQASLGLKMANGLSVSAYVDNLFNEYIETGVRGTPAFDKSVSDINGDPVYVRTYGTFVAPPRRIGVRTSFKF
ncbi:TonB-dependent receptor [Pacificimonas sp. WHA3]|uniref:TonB-dependent receptor n=1 Tax=Pacificimonas pallii TaxID=2827236 RepID=A0ABS6SAR6_9SPHN|nr:TonB-dependent receptor [Pacificimonas pallii]MBV7255493.1 TonB-dependent receptor [Pacificimonas pallii]